MDETGEGGGVNVRLESGEDGGGTTDGGSDFTAQTSLDISDSDTVIIKDITRTDSAENSTRWRRRIADEGAKKGGKACE